MDWESMVVHEGDAEWFLSLCSKALTCFRCGEIFGKGWSCLAQIQYVEHKACTRLTGGSMCKECGKSFNEWVEQTPQTKGNKRSE